MSWSFHHHGTDKEALKAACRADLENSVRYHTDGRTHGRIDPVIAAVENVIDAARLPASAYCFKIESSGHLDGDQCYFGVTITPVYLPELVKGKG